MASVNLRTYLYLLVLSVFVQSLVCGLATDDTRLAGTAGSNVVSATVSLIQESGMFPPDNRMLRRLAYVETKDGLAVDTYREGYFGGIWQVDQGIFDQTLNTVKYPQLTNIYTNLVNKFNIDWSAARWDDLAAPLFSALAAKIYFIVINEHIPQAGNLSGQANYWKMFYNSNSSDTEQYFIDSVNDFELKECSIRGIDLAFVFDSSASVGEANFEREKQFAVDVTNTFTISPNDTRVANIVFSGFANVSFTFDNHTDKMAVTEALSGVEYFDFPVPPYYVSTYTADALVRLRKEVFSVEGGARERRFGIPRIAVIVTDGRSNVNESETIPSAQALHDDNVVVFAVGVGDRLNLDELMAIGSNPDFVILLSFFDAVEFASLTRTISAEVCVVPAPITVGEEVEGVLENGDMSFFQFQLPTIGMTLLLEGKTGETVLYASNKIRNPNSAFYDFHYNSREDKGGLFISPEMFLSDGESDRTKRVAGINMASSNVTNITVYVSMEGFQDMNEFTLQTVSGNASSGDSVLSSVCTLLTLLLLTLSILV